MIRPVTGFLAAVLSVAGLPALAQSPVPPGSPRPSPQAPGTSPAAQLVQVIIRAQGTGDRYAQTHSFLCEEGRFCTAVFDVARRRADARAPGAGGPAPAPSLPPDGAVPPGSRPPEAQGRPAPEAPTRLEIGVWSRPEGEVSFVAITPASKLMLNCRPLQTVATKGRSEAPRVRYSVHEPDPSCGSGADRAPAEKAVAAIEIVVRPASLQRGQGI